MKKVIGNHIFLALTGLMCFSPLWSCSGIKDLPRSTQFLPNQAGIDINLDQLVRDFDKYRVLYSAHFYNPSAIVFIPRSKSSYLRPISDWKTVEDKRRLNYLLNKMDVLRPKLHIIQPRSSHTQSMPEVLGYIYTQGYASMRHLKNKVGYALRSVPEQFNPNYDNWDEAFFHR